MQFSKSSETLVVPCIIRKMADIPGGVLLMKSSLKGTTTEVKAGTVIGEDASSTGQYHVVKTAKLHADATDAATGYQVKKNHEFLAGDIITTNDVASCKAYAITEIDTSNADYDVLTVGTTLGVAMTAANGIIISQADSEDAIGGASTWKYAPKAITGHTIAITTGDNHFISAIIFGVFKESLLPFYINSSVKTSLGANIKFL